MPSETERIHNLLVTIETYFDLEMLCIAATRSLLLHSDQAKLCWITNLIFEITTTLSNKLRTRKNTIALAN